MNEKKTQDILQSEVAAELNKENVINTPPVEDSFLFPDNKLPNNDIKVGGWPSSLYQIRCSCDNASKTQLINTQKVTQGYFIKM